VIVASAAAGSISPAAKLPASATHRFDIGADQVGGPGRIASPPVGDNTDQLLEPAGVATPQSGGQRGDGGGLGGDGGGGLDGGGEPVVDVQATFASAVSFEPSEKVASA
jgi:hypothetical protein